MSQTEALQVAWPCCGSGHGSQEPQCCGSFAVETQRLPQRVGAAGGQVATQPPGPQSGVAPPQACVHEPQWAGSPRSVSQPGAALQSAKPVKQALTTTQLPTRQVTLAP